MRGLDSEVNTREIFGFLGPNGAGKTTTICILTGFLRASGGRRFDPGPCRKHAERREIDAVGDPCGSRWIFRGRASILAQRLGTGHRWETLVALRYPCGQRQRLPGLGPSCRSDRGEEPIQPEARALLFIGLLGGFTTFSTFGFETSALFRDGEIVGATANVVLQVLLGVGAASAGYHLATGVR